MNLDKRYQASNNTDLVQYLKDKGTIKSDIVFNLMNKVDRKNFVIDPNTAYIDAPVSIGYGKTISAPHMHAIVLELLADKLRSSTRVLDIGFGTGYLTTCFALAIGYVGHVVGMDFVPEFKTTALSIIRKHYPDIPIQDEHPIYFKRASIELVVGNGRLGYPSKASYHIIHVGAAAADIPQSLIDQLAPGGRLIMPVGISNQVLVQVDKSINGKIEHKGIIQVRYGMLMDYINQPNEKVENHERQNKVNAQKMFDKSNEKVENHEGQHGADVQQKIDQFKEMIRNHERQNETDAQKKFNKSNEEVENHDTQNEIKINNVSSFGNTLENILRRLDQLDEKIDNESRARKNQIDQINVRIEKMELNFNDLNKNTEDKINQFTNQLDNYKSVEKQVNEQNLTNEIHCNRLTSNLQIIINKLEEHFKERDKQFKTTTEKMQILESRLTNEKVEKTMAQRKMEYRMIRVEKALESIAEIEKNMVENRKTDFEIRNRELEKIEEKLKSMEKVSNHINSGEKTKSSTLRNFFFYFY